MKIYPTAIALACLTGVSARSFAPPNGSHGSSSTMSPGNITTAANFDAKGVNMEVCPTGDCTNGKFMKLTATGLTEFSKNGSQVVSVTEFKPRDSDWTAIVEEEVAGVTVSSTMFVSTLAVGSSSVQFNLTASIYQGNASVAYGNGTLTVPAGALKFTVDMSSWPFASPDNTLSLIVQLDAKGPKGAGLGKPEKKRKPGNETTVDRVDMGDSMFMDTPTYAYLDGVYSNLVNSSVIESAGDTAFEWVFSSFNTTLHYDPVLGEDTTAASSTGSEGSASVSGSSTGSKTTASSKSSASKSSIPSLVAAGLAVLAYSFF